MSGVRINPAKITILSTHQFSLVSGTIMNTTFYVLFPSDHSCQTQLYKNLYSNKTLVIYREWSRTVNNEKIFILFFNFTHTVAFNKEYCCSNLLWTLMQLFKLIRCCQLQKLPSSVINFSKDSRYQHGTLLQQYLYEYSGSLSRAIRYN